MNWQQLVAVLIVLLALRLTYKKSVSLFGLMVLLTSVYLLMYLLVKRKCTQVETFIFKGKDKGPSVLIVGTTHGNEPAGGEALNRYLEILKTQMLFKGTLTVIPCLNPCGKALGIRSQPHQLMILSNTDLNRNYPTSTNEQGTCPVSQALTSIIKQYDFVIDLHEGWGYHHFDPESLGSGIYPNKQPLAEQVATQMGQDLNQSINEESKQFVVQHIPDIPGSLRSLCDLYNISYVLIETSGQNNIQPLDTRANQHLTLIQSALRKLGMIHQSSGLID